MTFRPELIDELLKEYRNPEDLMGEGGIFKQLSKALLERCLSAELDPHLAEEKAASEIDALGGGKAETPRLRDAIHDLVKTALLHGWINTHD
jgi:hypothetical protein